MRTLFASASDKDDSKYNSNSNDGHGFQVGSYLVTDGTHEHRKSPQYEEQGKKLLSTVYNSQGRCLQDSSKSIGLNSKFDLEMMQKGGVQSEDRDRNDSITPS